MPSGRCRYFNSDRGFGFIAPDNRPGENVFVHVSQLNMGRDYLIVDERVRFEIGPNPKNGRPQAIDVRLVDR
jgi:cold shock protein